MNNIQNPMAFSMSTSVLTGGYACAGAGTFAARERVTAAIKQLPGAQVWSPPT